MIGTRTSIALTILAAAAVAAQAPPEIIRGQERVTTLDVFVEAPSRPGASPEDPGRSFPRDQLRILLDGTPVPVIAADSGESALAAPWTIVVAIDPLLAEDETLRWTAIELGEHLPELVSLGEVEIVELQLDGLRTLGRSSDDPASLERALSGIALLDESEDDILALRADFQRLASTLEQPRREELAVAATQLEARVIEQRLDRLLLHLVDGAPATERRLLLLVSDGWDLAPGRFYAGAAAAAGEGLLVAPTQTFASELAAHDWLVVPLTHPPRVVQRGIRIGKLFLQLPRPDDMRRHDMLAWLKVTWEEHRDPKLAAGYLANGRALLQSGDFSSARDALTRAAFHYGEDPRTFPAKAQAMLGLVEAFLGLGDSEAARRAASEALWLDPSLAETETAASFLDPGAALELLASASAGTVVRQPADLDPLLASLRRRLRVTVQIAGQPDGELHSLEIRKGDDGKPLRTAGWVRWGPSPGVAAARARTTLDDRPQLLQLNVQRQRGQPTRVAVPEVWRRATERSPICRLTLAWGDSLRPAELWQHTVAPCAESTIAAPEVGEGEEGLAVVLEELESGQWRRAWVETED